jgi:hypothetical protein
MVTNTEKRVNEHSKKIDRLEEKTIEQFRLLTSIDKKLTDEFFEKIEDMYKYLLVDNGTLSMKSWRREIDRERTEKQEAVRDWQSERRKWIYGITLFSLGVFTNYIFTNLLP